ncbi:MAG: GGDEF domain-containing protein [Bryobacteraceae bacterium]|jgi:diguanylate cyclase (GGDEF)-like protein
MDATSQLPDITAFYIQEIGAVLFGLAFLFLWRQSRVVYFGLWAVAWGVRAIATVFAFELLNGVHAEWLALYAVFEFAFVILLVSAARAGFASAFKDWRATIRSIAALPVFVALVWAYGRRAPMEAYQICHAAALCFVYVYNFVALRRNAGVGARIFRFSLLVLAVAFLQHGALVVYLYHTGGGPAWFQYLRHETYYDFVLHCLLAFAAMAMWSESQIDRLTELSAELDHVRRESAQRLDLDRLTGLLNQTALARRVEEATPFAGVVAVCDMDAFKDINDRYGHLAGDEILRSIGHLLQGSIRLEDEAFRWGGDEFVILFHNQLPEVARRRMADIETRLRDFRLRGLGALPISFSWGTAEAGGRPLRVALDEADRAMYARKRARAAGESGVRPPPA